MKLQPSKSVSYVYLLLIPFITSGLGFGVGHVSYRFYLPIWLLNAALMIIASWSLGLHVVRSKNEEERNLAKAAFLFIAPWILISMMAGLGPPPDIASEWTATAKEQQVRYFMLAISGVLIAFGFAGLRNTLKTKGENFYSLLSITAVLIAIPLFIINMFYWGFYLTELFRIQTNANTTESPEWTLPVKQLFGSISVMEVALTYLATLTLAFSMKKVGWLSKNSTFLYVLLSLLAFAVIILSAFFTETFKTAGFAVSIPAIPFLMPYFMGVNLLLKIGNNGMRTS